MIAATPIALSPVQATAGHRWRPAGAWMALFLALTGLAAADRAQAGSASSQRIVNPAGGNLPGGTDGLRWALGSNSQFQVWLGGLGQVYFPGHQPTGAAGSSYVFNSVFLRVDRGTDASTRIYQNSDAEYQIGANGEVRFTQVSQSPVSGSGTAASPWVVTTVLQPSVAIDSGITVTITDSYVTPQSWLTRRVALTGLPASGATMKLYQAIDSYLINDDRGPGFVRTSPWNATGVPDVVGVVKGNQFEALWYEPSSGTPHWDRYYTGEYRGPGRLACHGTTAESLATCPTGTGNLNNLVNPNPLVDNGFAAQWDIPPGAGSFTAEYRITFAMATADLTKSFAPDTIFAGETSTLTFDLTSRTVNATSSINFIDTLPAGVVVAAVPNVRTNCPNGGAMSGSLPPGMSVGAAAGGGSIQVAGASVQGAPLDGEFTCQVLVDVTSAVVGQHHNRNANIGNFNNLVNLIDDEVLTVIAQPSFGTCDARMFLSQGGPSTTLYNVDTSGNPFGFPPIGTGSYVYNATGYNPADNYLYAMRYLGSGMLNHLLRIGSDGATVNLGAVSGLPSQFYNSGAFDGAGTYYVKPTGDNGTMYAINVGSLSATPIPLNLVFGASDMAFVGGTLYAVSNSGQLHAIDPGTGVVTNIGTATGGDILGAQFGAPNGLFGSGNNGGFYQIDLATGARTLISISPSATSNDGANCPTVPITFPADLSVTKTNTPAQGPDDLADDTYAPGETRTYTVVVTNHGPFGVQNATVSDPVPAGIDPGAVTWTCTSTSGGAVCGAPGGTGALLDTGLDLPADAVATYTMTLTVPATHTGDLANTATVVVPPANTDPTPGNNTATDVDPSAPLLTIRKVSVNGVGSFDFTGTNGVPAQTLTTTVAGTPVAGATQPLTTASVVTGITEGMPPTGYVLTDIACAGLGAGGAATPDLPNRTVTLDAAATAAGADIVCTFTNTLQVADLEVVKTASPSTAISGDGVTYTLTVTNHGPAAADNAVLTDAPGAGLDCTVPSATAACAATGGASCPGATVPVGDLLGGGITIPVLPAGAQVMVTLQCTVTASGL